MMNRHQFLLMLSTCILIPGTASSAYNGQYPSQAVFNPDFSTTAKQTLTDSKTTNADNLFLPLPNIRSFSKSAKVCFITDKGNCSGNSFETPPDPFPPTPDSDKCYELGFRKTSCEAGWQPYRYCPYDSKYFKECICKDTCAGGYQEKTCSSGSIVADSIKMSCKTCYKCRSCKDECPGGYSTGKGTCNQESSNRTECGSVCYKIISNTCTTGSLTAPLENDSQKNKIVSYTACSNPCFQSYSDVCDSGYTKNAAVSGKCYDTMTTTFGTVCRKEKPCCDDSCNGYKTIPTASQCPKGYTGKTNGCGTTCYTCTKCEIYPHICDSAQPTDSELDYLDRLGYQSKKVYNACSVHRYNSSACTKYFTHADNTGWALKPQCYNSVSNFYEYMSNLSLDNCSFSLSQDIGPTSFSLDKSSSTTDFACSKATSGGNSETTINAGSIDSEWYYKSQYCFNPTNNSHSVTINLNGHAIYDPQWRYGSYNSNVLYQNGTLLYLHPSTISGNGNTSFKNVHIIFDYTCNQSLFYPNPETIENLTITCKKRPIDDPNYGYSSCGAGNSSLKKVFNGNSYVTLKGYLKVENCGDPSLGNIQYENGAYACVNGKKYPSNTSGSWGEGC